MSEPLILVDKSIPDGWTGHACVRAGVTWPPGPAIFGTIGGHPERHLQRTHSNAYSTPTYIVHTSAAQRTKSLQHHSEPMSHLQHPCHTHTSTPPKRLDPNHNQPSAAF
ncbi:hypothetical protein BKA56DRAFT_579204 [Ilyonectria sp. MPI-CAGE-AT-0026]|nr:hypothetical protein BKA56DRAFT_579204 [Ilyonectria sp. MPI-CAGE-AT-0026]